LFFFVQGRGIQAKKRVRTEQGRWGSEGRASGRKRDEEGMKKEEQ
jgi:hypothetical protein